MGKDKNRVERGYLQTTKYFNNSLNPKEQMLYRAHLSWIPVFARQIPFMLIGGLAGGISWGVTANFMFGLSVFAGICIIGIISQFPRIWTNIGTDILITNQGLHAKRGVFVVKDDRFTRLNMLDDSDIDYATFFQRVFQYGNVEVKTVAGDDSFYNFKGLARPITFKNTLRAAQNKYLGSSTAPFERQAQMGTGGYPQPQQPQQPQRAAQQPMSKEKDTLHNRRGGGTQGRR